MSNAPIVYEPREMTWEQQVEHVITQLAAGRSIHSILNEDEGMPVPGLFYGRLYRDDELFAKISRAREFGVEACLEKAAQIALTPMEGEEVTHEVGPEGVKVRRVRKDMVAHRRLAVETLVKRAQMIQPRKYGPKVDVTSDGEKIGSVVSAIVEGNKRIEKARGEK